MVIQSCSSQPSGQRDNSTNNNSIRQVEVVEFIKQIVPNPTAQFIDANVFIGHLDIAFPATEFSTKACIFCAIGDKLNCAEKRLLANCVQQLETTLWKQEN